MNRKSSKVDEYLKRPQKRRDEIAKLRSIILGCQLSEDLKWGKPCYTFQDSNVVVIQAFKAYSALLFFKGFLLNDPHGILVKTGVNTRVGRQIRFTNVSEIVELEPILKTYIQQAIEVEKSGVKVKSITKAELVFPAEFQKKLDEDAALKAAFDALTPGRQRGYNLYFSAPKQSKTRESRIDKCVKRILAGKGLND